MSQLDTQVHEAGFRWKLPQHGLRPYWLLSRLLFDAYDGGIEELPYEADDGEQWSISLRYHKSGFKPRPNDNAGDRLYEFDLHAEGQGERKVTFTISPRFPDMRHYDDGEPVDIPWNSAQTRRWSPDGTPRDAQEAIDVDVQGSNLELDEYRDLLPQFVDALALNAGETINPDLFHGPIHPSSRIYALERYIRLSRGMGQKLIGRTGIMFKLGMLLADQQDLAGTYQFDNEDAVGKFHVFKMGRQEARELLPGHSFGRQLKHYLLGDPNSVSEEDSTYHPKVGVRVDKELNDGTAIPWHRRDELETEIEEMLLNSLQWADIPIQPDPTTYVADDHFQVRERDRDVATYDDPTPQLEAEQDHLLMTVLRDMTSADEEIVTELAADGGTHYEDLADETGRGISTIYRALQRLDGVLESENGLVKWKSLKMRDEIHRIVESTEHQIRNAADRAQAILGLELANSENSAMQEWLDKYGAEVETREGEIKKVRIDTVLSRLKSTPRPRVSDVLDELLRAWSDAGRDPVEMRHSVVEFEDAARGRVQGLVAANL